MDAIEKFREFLNDELKSLQKYVLLNKEFFVLLNKEFLIVPDLIQNQDKQNSVFQQFDMMYAESLSRDRNDYIRNTLARLTCLKNFIRFTNITEENQLFHDFESLCTYLEIHNFTPVDIIQIIFFAIENNLKYIPKEKDKEKKAETIPPFRFTIASIDEMAELYQLSHDEIFSLRMKCKDIEDCGKQVKSNESFVPTLQLFSTHNTIKKNYLDKLDTYTESDIKKVICAFYQLKVPGNLCGKLERELKKELQKRKKETINISKQESSHKEVSTKLLTDKEYKEKLKQIKDSYNEYTGEILKPITEEQVIQLAKLMIQLDYDRKRINQFYQDVNRNRVNQIKDSVTEFYMLYSKFEFYSKHNQELSELLEEAISYLFELFGCLDEDYSFWHQEFQDVVFKLKMRTPNTFDYEYAQAASLVEQENQKRKEFQ